MPVSRASLVRRLVRHLRPHTGALAITLLLALIAGMFELVRPWTVKIVVDYVLGDRPTPPMVAGAMERCSPTTGR